ncbi:MAG: UDP-galactopyranose mutase [Lachnospiraceae bacterium]|nr:UDP-galactopyranose mutase [Lachnospiraceae bacterium]
MKYDYLIVGAGLFGAVFANEMKKAGKKCLVIDKRGHIAGNIYTEEINGIHVHKYGAHIFHTSDKRVWQYVNELAEFNNYINSPVAVYQDELYNLPFNMNTFAKMWNIRTPKEAAERIRAQIADLNITNPSNLEEQALSLVGTDIYEKLVKGYTEKQWGRDCKELPAFIIKRLPVRFTFDNNYFNDPYQGIPKGGYTGMVSKLLDGITVKLHTAWKDYAVKDNKTDTYVTLDGKDTFEKVLYTGMIDEFFDYCEGALEYRSLRFETELLEGEENYQGNAVVNYTEREVPFTRIIEHKHFEFGHQPDTVITREYPKEWNRGDEPYYPVNDGKNAALYQKYAALASSQKNVLFGGRLGQYQYYDMDKVILAALKLSESELSDSSAHRLAPVANP